MRLAVRRSVQGFLALSFVASTAFAAGALERLKKEGKFTYACDFTYPPMGYEGADGKPTGWEIDLADALGKKLGVKSEAVTLSWDGILPGLNSKRFDVVLCSMNVTPERVKQADFVEYMRMAQVIVSKKGKNEAKTLKELEGKVIAVQADTTSMNFVEEEQKKGLKIKSLKSFKMTTDAFAAVKAGQADAIVTDEPVGRYYAAQDSKTFVVTGEAMKPEPVGIAIRKSEPELKKAIEDALKAIEKDGTLAQLSQKWFKGSLSKY